MSHIQAIKSSIQYIENNIDKDIHIDDVARSVHYSTYHFSRTFLKNTGITIGSYVNLRKIGFASSQLLHSSASLIDISSYAGYKSYEAFSREIKSKFGISPYYFRNKKTLYYLMNRSLLDDELLTHLGNNLVFIPTEITLADFEVIGYSVTTSLMDNQLPLLWNKFNVSKEEILGDLSNTAQSFSICESSQAVLNEDGNCTFSEFLSFEKLDCKMKTPKEFVTQTIKGGKYIMFEHRTSCHSLNLTYRYIWNIWIHTSQIKFDDTRKSFERYTDNKELIRIYIPIK